MSNQSWCVKVERPYQFHNGIDRLSESNLENVTLADTGMGFRWHFIVHPFSQGLSDSRPFSLEIRGVSKLQQDMWRPAIDMYC